MTLAQLKLRLSRPSLSAWGAIAVAVFGAVSGGCAVGPTISRDDHSPQELVTFANANNAPHYLSRPQLADTVASRTRYFQAKCQAMGGTPNTLFADSTFADRQDASKIKTLSLQGGTECLGGAQPPWGVNIRVADGTYLTGAPEMFHGQLAFSYVGPEEVAKIERERAIARDAALRDLTACKARVADDTARLRQDPQVGMQTGWGVIVEVREPLVLIQYSPEARALRAAGAPASEWLQAESTSSAMKCH